MAYIEQVLKKYPEELSKFLNKRLGEIEEEIKLITTPLIKERQELLMALKEMKYTQEGNLPRHVGTFEDFVELSEVYDNKATNIDKTVFVLKKNGWLSLNDIANRINMYEPKSEVKKIKDTLSSVLRMEVTKDNSRITRRKNSENKWEYNVAQ